MTDWMDDALCRQVDTELMYPEQGCTTRPAKMLCAACPVRRPCLAYALDNAEEYGVFGGLSPRERRRLTTVPDTHPAWDKADRWLAAADHRRQVRVTEPRADPTPPPRPQTIHTELWMEMWGRGATDREMADAVGVPPNKVIAWRHWRKMAINPSTKRRWAS